MKACLPQRLKTLRERPDFQRDPATAIFRRLVWRLRWKLSERPWPLALDEGLTLEVPCCAAGALIYYQGHSEPETVRFVKRTLCEGMVFFDVGAHLGEYTLLASHAVGATGEVHAFEPQPDTFGLLKENVDLNRLRNVKLNACAVSDRDAEVDFSVRSEPSLSAIVRGVEALVDEGSLCRIKVTSRTLDEGVPGIVEG